MFTLQKTLKPSSIITTSFRLITTVVNLPSPATSAAYDDLINTSGRQRDFAAVRHLLNQRSANGFLTTTNTFNFVSTDLSILNDVLTTFSDLTGHSRKRAYDSLISSLCKTQFIDEALKVAESTATDDSDNGRRNGARASKSCVNRFKQVLTGTVLPALNGADASTFHPILNAVTRRKDFETGRRVVETMKARGVARDVTCYNYFITAYSVAGDLRSNAEVLRMMAEEGLKADARTYDALVLGACKVGKVDAAVALLRKMVEEGVGALYATYAHVIGSLVRLDYCAQAVELVVCCGGRDKGLDSHNFGLLSSRLIGMRKMDEGKYVLEEMVKRGLEMGEKLQKCYDEIMCR